MKISIWIRIDDVEKLKELIDSESIGPYLKDKYKGFEFYNRDAGPLMTGGVKSIQVLVGYDAFIQLRDNFECV
jgi:hypothetical protein